ncbi:MAG: NAD(P)-dependent oxidoreductase, partial [Ignavibacteriaceae bacterium]|nr:NAD(P)-dependent oxidoreductase [Ignavibacteriaceae bacterium]
SQAVWVDESLIPHPRDIYDISKLTAELLCRDFFEKNNIESTVLRVSRFLPETENLKAIHRLYRGLDEKDGAAGIILAIERTFKTFEIYNISNESPFKQNDLTELIKNPKQVIKKYFPNIEEIFAAKNWVFPEKIDRVYSIEKAKRELNYQPTNNFDSFISN